MNWYGREDAYKDAVQKNQQDKLNLGTLCYPVLMAADMLLYDADAVPVGKDQKQHGELARALVKKMNMQYGNIFQSPDIVIQQELATIPGIDGRKMSKSYKNTINMFDQPDVLRKKVKQIQTNTIPIQEKKSPDQCHVYNILRLFLSPSEDEQLRHRYLQ